jgi:choloylglycine hydrolase
VRTSYLKTHVPTPKDREEAIVSCFHIMESVSIPRGAVMTDRDTYDYTKYTAFINTNTCEYFFKTYDNIQIGTASLYEAYTKFDQPVNLGELRRPLHFDEMIK